MKKLALTFTLLMVLFSCTRYSDDKQPASDLRFCGRWMTLNPNQEYFSLKSDGSYTDLRFASMSSQFNLPKGTSWFVKGNVLYLNYDFSRQIAHLVKIPVEFKLRDTVKAITDSTMVLATISTKEHPSQQITLVKMKENGQYTRY